MTRRPATPLPLGSDAGDQVLQRCADGLHLKAIGTVFDHSVACFVNRDLVVKFIRASRKGWEYAQAHPDEAVDNMVQLNPQMARDPAALAAQRRMCQTVVKNLQAASGRPIFTMDPARWNDMTTELISVNRLGSDFHPRLKEICDYTVADEASK